MLVLFVAVSLFYIVFTGSITYWFMSADWESWVDTVMLILSMLFGWFVVPLGLLIYAIRLALSIPYNMGKYVGNWMFENM